MNLREYHTRLRAAIDHLALHHFVADGSMLDYDTAMGYLAEDLADEPTTKGDSDSDDAIAIIAQTLSFLTSVIKSGEPWTAQCEAAHNDAVRALDKLDTAPATDDERDIARFVMHERYNQLRRGADRVIGDQWVAEWEGKHGQQRSAIADTKPEAAHRALAEIDQEDADG